MGTIIRRANRQDLPALRDFLARAGLGTEGLSEETAQYFLLLENEDQTWSGTLGIQPFNDKGLLRSLAVSAGQAPKDILSLFQQALFLAKDKKLQELYLATNKTGAVSLFEMLGFGSITDMELPRDIAQSEHIKQLKNVDNLLFLKLSFPH